MRFNVFKLCTWLACALLKAFYNHHTISMGVLSLSARLSCIGSKAKALMGMDNLDFRTCHHPLSSITLYEWEADIPSTTHYMSFLFKHLFWFLWIFLCAEPKDRPWFNVQQYLIIEIIVLGGKKTIPKLSATFKIHFWENLCFPSIQDITFTKIR